MWNTSVGLDHQNVLKSPSSSREVTQGTGTVKREKNPLRDEATLDTESMITVKEVINGFDLHYQPDDSTTDELWDLMETDLNLEQQIVQFVHDNPGRSYRAIFKYFRDQGFTYTDILETYNVLVYSKEMLMRLNVGTTRYPRYAHFVAGYYVRGPGKDALYDILGPI